MLNIVSKYKKNISVDDMKEYLVKEFNENKKLQKEIYQLQDELTGLKEYEKKYNLSLVALEEYKEKVQDKERRNEQLTTQISNLQDKIKQNTNEICDLTLEDKRNKKYIENMKPDVRKEVIDEFKEKINELKGHIKKDDILRLFE